MLIKQTRNTLSDAYLDALKIRRAVFVAEQGVPESLEIDAKEAHCLHFVLYDEHQKPAATCRLLPDSHFQCATLQRMAVLKAYRKRGFGKVLMHHVIQEAKNQGFQLLELHAQLSAQPFYAKLNFEPKGPIFTEAGIEHVTMQLKL
ncbi:GNAT family N-acetyltransferase [Streptococcus ictaluri]|uniref:Acetyltransferase, GNAT family n=1 Tax=Streptococcus ictaluri 707-05 TaxID=764299 RepID=G5JZU8_9STRE|nr:GNAT family N-acetyltransferase [Streptococcus ictaluri]EHI70892.1 acetyltransferase, GNAT family [Streptococcus ictaluri 707-05]